MPRALYTGRAGVSFPSVFTHTRRVGKAVARAVTRATHFFEPTSVSPQRCNMPSRSGGKANARWGRERESSSSSQLVEAVVLAREVAAAAAAAAVLGGAARHVSHPLAVRQL